MRWAGSHPVRGGRHQNDNWGIVPDERKLGQRFGIDIDIDLIAAVAFLNLNYAIDEIKAILPWVPKSSIVIHSFWQEISGALFPGGFKPGCSSVAGVMMCILYCTPSALLALVIAPPFALCYSLYKYLEEDVWNAIDLIYTSLVWVSLGYHIYTARISFEFVCASPKAPRTNFSTCRLQRFPHVLHVGFLGSM